MAEARNHAYSMAFIGNELNQTNYQGCQFDVHCIPCQTSTEILGIVNEFSQYVQNYFQYVNIPS